MLVVMDSQGSYPTTVASTAVSKAREVPPVINSGSHTARYVSFG